MNEYYNEGFSAYTEGQDYSDNPYPGMSTRHNEWADGWTSAQMEDDDGELLSYEESEEDRYADWL